VEFLNSFLGCKEMLDVPFHSPPATRAVPLPAKHGARDPCRPHRHQTSSIPRQVYQTNIFLGLASKAYPQRVQLQSPAHRRKLDRRAGPKAKLYCPFFQMIRCVHLPMR
jgi:hypothetical protein